MNDSVFVIAPIEALGALVVLGIMIYGLFIITRDVQPLEEPLAREQETELFTLNPPMY